MCQPRQLNINARICKIPLKMISTDCTVTLCFVQLVPNYKLLNYYMITLQKKYQVNFYLYVYAIYDI